MSSNFDNVTVPVLASDGTLTQFVQLKTNNAGWYNRYTRKYTLRFKGPTSQMTRLNGYDVYVGGVIFTLGSPLPTMPSSVFIMYQSIPTLDSKHKWYVDSINISHSDGGDQSIIELVLMNDWAVGGGYQPGPPPKPNSDSESEDIIIDEKWNLTWGNENVSVLMYCDPDFDYGAEFDRFIVDEGSMPTTQSQALREPIKSVPAIKACATPSNHTEKYTSDEFEFVRGPAVYKIKNADIQKIYKYYVAGENPIQHFPILTRIQTRKTNNTKIDVNDGSIDTTGYPPSGNPFNFKLPQSWLYVDNKISQVADKTFTITDVWWGSAAWNEDFYGPNRWVVKSVPLGNGN